MEPDNVDSDGYPLSLSAALSKQVQIPGKDYRAGHNLVVKWEGDGTIDLQFPVGLVSGSNAGVNGRAVYQPRTVATEQDFLNIRITATNASNHLKNLRVCWDDEEDLLDSGEVFSTKFLQVVNRFRPGVWRFLDMQSANIANISKAAHRKPVTWHTWAADEIRPSLYVGTTTNVGDDYSCTDQRTITPADKETVHIKWNATATTATCTLNGIPLAWPYGDSPNDINNRPGANTIHTLVYDADFGKWLQFGSRTTPAFLTNHIPWEIMVALCNKIGAHPWVHIPYLCLDPVTDFAQSLAEYLRDNLDSGLIPRFEPANEVWNSAAGFHATRFGWNKGKVHWPGQGNFNHDDWYGRVSSQIGPILESVYSGDRTRYQQISAQWQADILDSSNQRRFTGKHVTVDGGTPAQNYVHALAPSGYWGVGGINETVLAFDYALGDAATKEAAIADLMASGYASIDGTIAIRRAYWKARANTLGIAYTEYEGGFYQDVIASDVFLTITGITKAAQAVVTVSSTSQNAPIGASLTITSVAGMTEINNQTVTVVSRNGQQVTVDLDTTTYSTYTSGGSARVVTSKTKIDAMRTASVLRTELFALESYNLAKCVTVGIEFPSCYNLAGPNLWAACYQTIYTETGKFDAHVQFNALAEPTPEVYQSPNVGGAGAPTIRRRAQYESYDTIIRRQKIREIEELRKAILARGPTPKLAEKAREFIPYNDNMSIRALVADLARAQQELEDEEEMIILALLH